jgi:hypothetical protein
MERLRCVLYVRRPVIYFLVEPRDMDGNVVIVVARMVVSRKRNVIRTWAALEWFPVEGDRKNVRAPMKDLS